ncbi:ParB/RepB/Spo0J family partition protein [Nonomuraea basaltis]|uniref:ParB/RepB/Spo0J family partition protein n=1 Tax=Nonomuraea basaltis TaxID=2495887 RepID=UPI00110C4447|nr:ParB/RepB/Spo0J family partition protein [Nonomuraea basaltis]TMR92648.1 ParB/RepB/Spo0J family partition protein [Nonomuraea basaltis]
MSQQRRGLGKGLGALIPTGPIVDGTGAVAAPANGSTGETGPKPIAGAYFKEVALKAIVPNPRQPREIFDEERLEELAASIREVGLLQPIVVRPVGGGQYELVMGERRWRACQQAGLDPVPAIVRNTQDTDLLRDALIENLQREQLNALEEAAAYQQLLDDFQATHEQLAQRVGRSRSHITNTLRLLNLPPEVQRTVAAGVISAGHARALLGLDSAEEQIQLAKRIVAELLSVRAVEEIVAMGSAKAAKNAPRERQPAKPTAPGLIHLADRLSDHFETKVKVDLGRRKGRIVVEFATIDDLERIIGTMAPEAVRAMRETED